MAMTLEQVNKALRLILAERKYRDDGDTETLLERVRHMSREDRDCIAMNEAWHRRNGTDDAHLSAQAKVRVTQVEVDRAWDIYTGVAGVFCSRDGMRNVLEDFAARLSQGDPTNLRECTQWSQGAKGESVAWQVRLTGRPRAVWEACTKELYEDTLRTGRYCGLPTGTKNVEVRQLYTHPTERAAVPDGWVLVPRVMTAAMINAWSHGKAVTSDVVVERSPFQDAWKRVLTAAPQPPEGARVVDGWQSIETAPNDGALHVRALHVFSSTDGRFLYWDAVAGHIDTEDGQFYDQGGDMSGWSATDFTHWHPLPAAPTLAGKEGSK